YVPERPAIKYLVALRDAEVWLAPIAGTRVLVPFRFSMPTPLGVGLLRATEFVTVSQPSLQSHPVAKTQKTTWLAWVPGFRPREKVPRYPHLFAPYPSPNH